MNYFKLIIHLVIVLLFTFSCKTFHKEVKEDIVSKEDSDTFFEVDNKKLDSNYIKAGCAITDSIKNQIPDVFAYTNFFHLYVQIKSYHPEHLNRFDCAEKLEKQVYFLFALDHEPLNKIDYQSNVEVFTVHREIMRNLHKIVGITKSGNGEYIDASGIKDGKLFDTKDKNFLQQILDSKSYVKFYSFLDEGSGNYQEFYIPIKNYNLIKDHLLVLDKDSRKMAKGKVSNFAISFSAMLHLISPEVIGKVRPMENKQFPWIEEISSTPYYSTIHPLSRFVAKDTVINDPLLMMGYGYPSRMFKSNVLLARILQETNILPKNFSIIPIIEKSLRSGNREYCGTISNPQGLLIVEKLHGKDFKVSKTYMKYCFGKNQIKIPSKSKYSSANNDGVKNINL
jgi:hypothetical protein